MTGRAFVSIKIEDAAPLASIARSTGGVAGTQSRTQELKRIDNVVQMIARRICKKPLDTPSLFGLFSGG
jgi:hypothetical protein